MFCFKFTSFIDKYRAGKNDWSYETEAGRS